MIWALPQASRCSMDKWLERIEGRLDKIEETLLDIQVNSVRNTASLEEHMRRTELAEASIEAFKEDLKPIQEHIRQVKTIFWLISSIGSGLVVIASLLRLLNVV